MLSNPFGLLISAFGNWFRTDNVEYPPGIYDAPAFSEDIAGVCEVMPLPAAVVSLEFTGVPSTSVVLGQPADTSVEPVQDNSSSLTSFLPPSEPHDHASALFCPRVVFEDLPAITSTLPNQDMCHSCHPFMGSPTPSTCLVQSIPLWIFLKHKTFPPAYTPPLSAQLWRILCPLKWALAHHLWLHYFVTWASRSSLVLSPFLTQT